MIKKIILPMLMLWGMTSTAQNDSDTLKYAEQQADTTQNVPKKKGLFGRKSGEDIVKKGISFGPLPVIAYDQDKGFQFGALLNLYDYADGSNYPNPRQQWYIEASAYTKGTQQYFLTYDTKHLIPHVRMSLATTVTFDKAMDFYGYNGYQSDYHYEDVNYWKKQKDKTGMPSEYMNAFYRLERLAITAKADFVGTILKNKLFWQASYYFGWYRYRDIDESKINKGKDSTEMFSGKTLYEKYIDWGIIPQNELDEGFTSALRIGIMYDTRDFEAAPSRGIWTEANLTVAPQFLGTTDAYYRYMFTFRHYIPLVKDRLTFAYRLNYQGTVGNYLPYYILPVFSNIGREYDRDGIGGYRTVRGLMRDRVQALDVGFFNLEFRWKMVQFHLWKQNIYLGLNAFCDGAIAVRNYDISYRGSSDTLMQKDYEEYVNTTKSDGLHLSAGGGLRIVINRNFIIAIDYAKPFNKQDGKGSLYINTGYLF
ncbi:MAG: outer membrane protein assembly factor [Bacteroidales bacterium]|jgi:outer membrane protein assembly factor BamA|nr:outer membrane protein assembly factor [Bacteroidales bacterium]